MDDVGCLLSLPRSLAVSLLQRLRVRSFRCPGSLFAVAGGPKGCPRAFLVTLANALVALSLVWLAHARLAFRPPSHPSRTRTRIRHPLPSLTPSHPLPLPCSPLSPLPPSTRMSAPRPHRLALEPHAFYLVAFGPLHQPISATSWFLACALPMRAANNSVMEHTQWMYTYGLERGRRVERDTYTPSGGTLEGINNVLVYRLTPARLPRQGREVEKTDVQAAGASVDMALLAEVEEKEWVGKLFVWRVLLELKRVGKIEVGDLGLLWNEIVREVEEGLRERSEGGLEPRVVQCSWTY
ncbi:hypothetical protein CALVIDRAFT_541595 [Calocera viscosa TUFC12733]|uniref:Uncharacterized protein n=1 Tax=Calocera viscosa (strain TUFC12733) TaxID=1330018 RepID=A0A167HJ92_CALVF|nr:hypothetical protein CALVIDRAFT_541595 [Calocera viscosa TUFC12733]